MKLKEIYKQGQQVGYDIASQNAPELIGEATLAPIDLDAIERHLKHPNNVTVNGENAIIPVSYIIGLMVEVRRLRRVDEAFEKFCEDLGPIGHGMLCKEARNRLWNARIAVTADELIDRVVTATVNHESDTYRQLSPFEVFAKQLNEREDSAQAWEEYERGVENGARRAAQEKVGAL